MQSTSESSPEQQLIVCCARAQLDAATRAEAVSLVREHLDWQRVASLAVRQDIVPLVARHLRNVAADRCPAPVLASLEAEAQRIIVINFGFAAELVKLLGMFEREGITAVGFKGPLSAIAYYGDLGARTFGDLDLFVPPEQIGTAWRLLLGREYDPQFALTPEWLAVHTRLASEHLFRHRRTGRLVDVHWSLMPLGYSFTPTLEGPFARRETVAVGTHDIVTFGPEAMLLFFCVHGAKHDWCSLEWVCDLAELIRSHPALDWSEVLEWSAAKGRRRFVDLGLRLAHDLLAAPVPLQVLDRGAADPALGRFAAEATAGILGTAGTSMSAWSRTVGSMFYRAMERRGDRLRFLHDTFLMPTPLEWQLFRAPPRLAPIFYAVRPVRLVVKHALERWLPPATGEPR